MTMVERAELTLEHILCPGIKLVLSILYLMQSITHITLVMKTEEEAA